MTITVVTEDRVLNFGKHKNEYLSKVPESYLKWLVSHKKVLAERNRHYAVLAEKMLMACAQTAAVVAKTDNANWNEWHQSLKNAEIDAKIAKHLASTPVKVDLGLKGNLNTSRAFCLMR